MRAASVLCEQIEEPIMWLAKKKTALEMRKVSTDVLGALVRWGTAEGAMELWCPTTRHLDPASLC